MATKIQVTSTEYLRELTNGQDFLTNTSDVSDHLLGHVGDRQRLVMTVQVSNRLTLGRYSITGGNTITLTGGQNWLNEDFYAGGSAYLSLINGLNYSFDIDFISADGTVMTVSNVVEENDAGTPTGTVILPDGDYGTGTDQDIIRSLVQSNGLVAKFGFVPNGGNVDFVSPLDNQIQSYKFSGLRPGGSPGPVITGTWGSSIEGSNTGLMTSQFIQDVADTGVFKSAAPSVAIKNSIQEFQIIQEFIIPYYEEGQFSNVESSTPPSDLIDSLKQVFEFEFRANLSDPNKTQFGEYNTVLGNVKYYNENYIDTEQQYSVSDVVLTDAVSGDTLTSIDASNTTRVNCSINSADGTFLTADPVLIEHSYLPNGDQYANQTNVFTDVWLRETLRNTVDAVASNGTILTGFTATLISANQIDIQFDIAFSVAQQTQLQDGYNYELSISVADSSLTVPLSDVTKLIIDAGQYSINQDISGLCSFDQSYLYTRPMTYPIVDPLDRFTSLKGWVQDGFLYDWTMNLDLVEGATLEALTLRLVAFQTLENTWFELDKYEYDLSGQVITAGPPQTQNITIDTTRGYDLADGDKLNFAKLQTGTYSAPNQPYTGQTGFRLNWQEWLALPTADTIFYDPAEPNNGLNKKSSRYSLVSNYTICVLIDARIGKVVDGVKVITQYIDRSADLEVYDFGEQDGSPITWTGTIQTFDESGADLGGTLLTEGLTTIKGTFSPDLTVSDPSLYWAEVRLERANNPGNDYYVLSSLEAGADNNPLQAPTGSTYTKIALDSGDVIVTADLDPSLLPDSGPWNASVRMGLINQSIPVVPTVEISIDGNTRQNDGDFIVFQQNEIMANAQLVDNLFSLTEAVTPGTPPGWQFKVSPTSAQPSGDAYVKANWGAISYIDFTTLASTLGANSDRWVYVEADDTTKIDEGFQIKFERPAAVQPTSNIIKSFAAGGIDQDGVIYFDNPVTFNSIVLSSGTGDLWLKIQTTTAALEDWTDLGLFGTDITLVSLNAITSAYADGTKWALHYAVTDELLETNGATVTFNFDYNHSTDNKAKTINVVQSDVDSQFRSDLVNCIDWKQVPAVNLSAQTDATDAALLSALNFANPVTVVAWIQLRESGLSSSLNNVLLSPLQTGLSNTDAGGMSFVLRQSNTFAQLYVCGQTGGASSANRQVIRWTVPSNMSNDRRCMVAFTCDGGQDITTGHEFYYNGIKSRNADKTFVSTGTPSGAIQPSTGIYHHGILQGSGLINNNPSKTERIEVYDKELNAQEIRTLFNYPDAGRDAVVSNLLRSWDFGNVTGANVPDTQASGKDMTIISSGSLPTNVSFY